MLIALLGALAIGLVMGVCGAGGGVLSVPLLVMALGLRMQEAAPIALVSISLGATLGALDGLRAGLARYRAALVIALVSLPFSALGVQLAARLPQGILMAGFAVVCLIAAWRMAHSVHDAADADTPPPLLDAHTGRFRWSRQTAAIMATVGASSGFLTGLFGVGGGFVIVPMLQRLTQLPLRGTVATSLLVMALVSAGGVGATLLHGLHVPALLTTLFAGATGAGLCAGRLLSRQLPARHVQRGFAGVLLLIGLAMLWAALRR